MRFVQHKTHPNCGAYLADYLTLLEVFSPKVYKAFCEVCEDVEVARVALLNGNGPLVNVSAVCKVNGRYLGSRGGPRHTVYINKQLANFYEHDHVWKPWESTVLHEAVHWARFIGGKPFHFQGKEAGKVFEARAYGEDIQCQSCTYCEK